MRQTTRLALATAVCILAAGGSALAVECQATVPAADRCQNQSDFITQVEPGSGGYYGCASTDPSAGDIQYDVIFVFRATSNYLCSIYATCAEIQSSDPEAYSRYCQ